MDQEMEARIEQKGYDDLVEILQKLYRADAVMMVVMGGAGGSGVSLAGTAASYLDVAELLEKVGPKIREDGLRHIREEQEREGLPRTGKEEVHNIELDLSEREAMVNDHSLEGLAAKAHKVVEFLNSVTESWDEKAHAIGMAMAIASAEREQHGPEELRAKTKDRTREILETMLKMKMIVAHTSDPAATPGAKVIRDEDLT